MRNESAYPPRTRARFDGVGPLAARTLVAILSLLAISTSRAQGDSPQAQLLTGEAFHRQLDAVVGIGWSDLSLRHTAWRVTDRWHLAVFLDRRVDPDQLVQFESAQRTLRETLMELADSLDLEVQFWDGLIYFGPPGAAGRVMTAAEAKLEEVRGWGEEGSRAARSREPLRWGMLAEPRDLVESLSESVSWPVENLEAVPHDLWWENELPPLPWSHRMTLMLAGFELTFELSSDRRALRIVPMPEEVVLERRYPLGSGKVTPIQRLQEAFPESHFQRVGNQVQVRGSATDHAGVRRMLRGAQSGPLAGAGPTTGAGRTADRRGAGRGAGQGAPVEDLRFTLRATNRVEAILHAVVQQTELQLDVPPGVSELLETRVTIEVEDARLEELLDRLIRQQGWTYELQGRQLKIMGPE